MSRVSNPQRDRSSVMRIARMYAPASGKRKAGALRNAGYGKPSTIAPSYLRQEVVLRNTLSSYDFSFGQNINATQPYERSIDRNDNFHALQMGMYIARRPTASAGSHVLQSYPAQDAFPAVAGFTPAHLESVYNGSFDYRQDEKVVMPGYPMLPFRQVPETQPVDVLVATVANVVKPQFDETFGRVALEPNITIFGNRKNTFTVKLAHFAGIQVESVTAGVDHVLVMVLFGFLASSAGTK